MNCQSCGMPMSQDSDHGGGRPDNIYCAHCTDSSGNLKSREEIREGMIGFYQQSIGKTREEAEIAVDAHMAQMPTWSGVSAAVGTTVPIDQLPEGTDPVGTVNPALPMESVKPVEPAEPVEPAPPVPVEPALPVEPPIQTPPLSPLTEVKPEPIDEQPEIAPVPPVPTEPNTTTPSEEPAQ